MGNLNLVDLFCGCGGLSLGFEHAGFDVLCGVDNDPTAQKTYESNHKNAVYIPMSLEDKNSLLKIQDQVGNNKVSVIVGGPPCQGFSLTGPRNFTDPRNTLYLRYWECVKKFLPEFFVIENVPGIGGLYGGKVKEDIISKFSSLGYNLTDQILLAADYGVPQFRRRMFFVGCKKKYGKFSFPQPRHNEKNYVSCSDAISDLQSRELELGPEVDVYDQLPLTGYQSSMRGKSKELFNHVGTRHTDLVKSVIRLVPEGGNHKDLPPGVGESRKFNEAWTRYHSQRPSKTIDTGHRNHFHYKWNRVPTIRENARLQSFPDDFRFWGTKTQQNRQVGNAVPPLLANAIAKEIKSHLITH